MTIIQKNLHYRKSHDRNRACKTCANMISWDSGYYVYHLCGFTGIKNKPMKVCDFWKLQ
jgi:hypothetical protein